MNLSVSGNTIFVDFIILKKEKNILLFHIIHNFKNYFSFEKKNLFLSRKNNVNRSEGFIFLQIVD